MFWVKKNAFWPKNIDFWSKNRFFRSKKRLLDHFGLFCEFGPIEVGRSVKNVSDELEG